MQKKSPLTFLSIAWRKAANISDTLQYDLNYPRSGINDVISITVCHLHASHATIGPVASCPVVYSSDRFKAEVPC